MAFMFEPTILDEKKKIVQKKVEKIFVGFFFTFGENIVTRREFQFMYALLWMLQVFIVLWNEVIVDVFCEKLKIGKGGWWPFLSTGQSEASKK